MLLRLKKRKDFLVVKSKGGYKVSPYFVIQYYKNNELTDTRVGFTATKKIGKAVQRNKCKRRLRALVHGYEKTFGLSIASLDLVFIARQSLLSAEFSIVQKKFEETLSHILKKCL